MHRTYSKLKGYIIYEFTGISLRIESDEFNPFGIGEDALWGGGGFGDSLLGEGDGNGTGYDIDKKRNQLSLSEPNA